ncbi:MAG: cation:dicarboxylate symporter family transporter, partial [Mucilaginibacter sp.]
MKKNRLTLYIIIALVLGVVTGYIYNTNVISQVNAKISVADANIKAIDAQITAIRDTTNNSAYTQLKSGRKTEVKQKQQYSSEREDKLEGFTILSDIFLRLIKMIVGPLIFTTLV